MLEKLIYATDEEVTLHANQYGRFNDPPVNLRQITEKEFAQSHFFTYAFQKREFRQMYVDKKTWNIGEILTKREFIRHTDCGYISGTLFFMHDDTGYMISTDYWNGKILYFRFGCQHDYHEITQHECVKRGIYHGGRCYHVSECSKCKHIAATDSSD